MRLLALGLAAVTLLGPGSAVKLQRVANVKTPGAISTDLAFWGTLAFQGHYSGFRVIDLSSPTRPAVPHQLGSEIHRCVTTPPTPGCSAGGCPARRVPC